MEFLVCGIATQRIWTKTTTHHSNAGIEIACCRFEKPHHEAEELFSDLGQIREQHVWTNTGTVEIIQSSLNVPKSSDPYEKPKMYSRSLWHIRSPSKTHAVVSWRSRLKLHEVKDKHANKTCEASGTRRHTKGFEILLLRMVST